MEQGTSAHGDDVKGGGVLLSKRKRDCTTRMDMHILRERMRREDMSNKFAKLESLLPACKTKRDRSEVVDDAIHFVIEMQGKLKSLQTSSRNGSKSKYPPKLNLIDKQIPKALWAPYDYIDLEVSNNSIKCNHIDSDSIMTFDNHEEHKASSISHPYIYVSNEPTRPTSFTSSNFHHDLLRGGGSARKTMEFEGLILDLRSSGNINTFGSIPNGYGVLNTSSSSIPIVSHQPKTQEINPSNIENKETWLHKQIMIKVLNISPADIKSNSSHQEDIISIHISCPSILKPSFLLKLMTTVENQLQMQVCHLNYCATSTLDLICVIIAKIQCQRQGTNSNITLEHITSILRCALSHELLHFRFSPLI